MSPCTVHEHVLYINMKMLIILNMKLNLNMNIKLFLEKTMTVVERDEAIDITYLDFAKVFVKVPPRQRLIKELRTPRVVRGRALHTATQDNREWSQIGCAAHIRFEANISEYEANIYSLRSE